MEWVIGENERELDLGRIRREDLLLHGWSLFRDELCRLVDDCAHVRGRHNHANNTVRTRTHLKVKRFVGKSLPCIPVLNQGKKSDSRGNDRVGFSLSKSHTSVRKALLTSNMGIGLLGKEWEESCLPDT